MGSITVLLGHLYGLGSMRTLTIWLWVPALVLAGVGSWSGVRAGDSALREIIRAGFWGGLWGTIGYDLFRIPFHGGYNLFGAIRYYGMWLCGADASGPLTDACGLAYHFANGISFGWVFALLAVRRVWLWALLWGLGLETVAVMTVFGEIFMMRQLNLALFLAYAAHLAYGYPLGRICQDPEGNRWSSAIGGWIALSLTMFVFGWFQFAWHPQPPDPVPRGVVMLHENGLFPGALEVEAGMPLEVRNVNREAIEVTVRHVSMRENAEVARFTLEPGSLRPIPVTRPGIYQIATPAKQFRSVILLSHRNGTYTDRAE